MMMFGQATGMTLPDFTGVHSGSDVGINFHGGSPFLRVCFSEGLSGSND